MKRNKKKFLVVLSLFSVFACVVTTAISNRSGLLFQQNSAEHFKYTLTMNTSERITDTETSNFTRNTLLGNPVSFTAASLNSRSGWWAQLASGTSSHLENKTSINGIETITIKSQFKAANGGYKLEAGVKADALDTVFTHTSGSTETSIVTNTFRFGGLVNYFKLSNTSNNCGTYIEEIAIEFSCLAADGTRDALERTSGDLLYNSYLNQNCGFDYPGFSADMRCSDVASSTSGYSAKFHCDPNVTVSRQKVGVMEENYPIAQIELDSTYDLRGYGLDFDIKFSNVHNWFAFSLLDGDGNYILKPEAIGVDTKKDLGKFVKAGVASADVNDATKLASGRTLDDLANVKYIEFLFNFDLVEYRTLDRDVVIDNIILSRGQAFEPPKSGDTYLYIDLGTEIPLTVEPFAAFDFKFNNPGTHQELGVNFYEENWGNYFGKYWIDTDADHDNKPYFEAYYKGLKIVPLDDGFYRLYVDPTKLDMHGETKPSEYIRYIWFAAPNTVANRGSGLIDVLPANRVHVTETYGENVAFSASDKVDATVDFPTIHHRGDGIVLAEFTFTGDSGKAAAMTGTWNDGYNGYYDIYKTSTGSLYTGVEAQITGTNKVMVALDLATMTKGSEAEDQIYKLFYVKAGWSSIAGTVSVYFRNA